MRKKEEMKSVRISLSVLLILSIFLTSCEDKRMVTYTANVPVYLSWDDLRVAIENEVPKAIVSPGKIYFKDQYIFLNEFMEGIHVIDISDPSEPEILSFIPIPGNVDMAIKDNILYADSYTDLILLDISDPTQVQEYGRINEILEYTLPPYDEDYPVAQIDEEEGVVIDWEVDEYTREQEYYPYPIYYGGIYTLDSYASRSSSTVSVTNGSAYGVGGSMARFITYDNYLYMLQESYRLMVVDIQDIDTPSIKFNEYVGWGLETMFIDNDFMYLGAMDGMYILSLEDPVNPEQKSHYRHVTSCDPVVVSGNRAYVTLRSGTSCGGNDDLLDVINISNKSNPSSLATYDMTEPYGLGIAGSTLFVCEGEYGLKVYDASDIYHIDDNKIAEFSDIKATDVIPINNLLFTVGDDGFYIYDYSDLQNIELVGSILKASE